MSLAAHSPLPAPSIEQPPTTFEQPSPSCHVHTHDRTSLYPNRPFFPVSRQVYSTTASSHLLPCCSQPLGTIVPSTTTTDATAAAGTAAAATTAAAAVTAAVTAVPEPPHPN